jgi:hypothetical protein
VASLLKLLNSGITLSAHKDLFTLSFYHLHSLLLRHSAAVLYFISFRPRRKGVERDLIIVLGLSSVLYTQSLSSRINTAVHNLPSADF